MENTNHQEGQEQPQMAEAKAAPADGLQDRQARAGGGAEAADPGATGDKSASPEEQKSVSPATTAAHTMSSHAASPLLQGPAGTGASSSPASANTQNNKESAPGRASAPLPGSASAGDTGARAKGPRSPGPQPQKAMYIFSQIFEKSDDIKNKPFVFEKHNLKKRKSLADYKAIKMQSLLILPKKKSALRQEPVSLNEINHDMDNISVAQSNADAVVAPQAQGANFKQKYFVFVENRIIQFSRDDDTMERGILNIKYARLKKTHLKDSKTKLFGFILMAKGQCIQFYNTSQQVIEEWIDALKDTVILLDLKDEFKMGDLLGRGNFAKVHSCTRKGDPDETKYALKTIEKANIKKCQRNIQSVLQEIDILRKLQHSHVIKLHEVYESNKYIHLVLSYLDGGELFERIKSRHVYQEKTAMSVMKNMLEALRYMHENKVVHRDLKPENLILASKDNDYDLRIADFGLASFVKEGEVLKLRCGSPGYVAPEILEDVGYDEKSDVFSAGVILYVLLTGRPVFRGYNLNEILLKNKRCDIEYPDKYWSKISNQAKEIVEKLLKKNPNERISAADALQHEWFNQDEKEMNDQKLDFAEGVEENEKQAQLIVDYKKKPREEAEEDLSILTATPIIGKRNLYPDVPETPFLTKNTLDKTNATPMMASGIIIQKAAAPKMQQMKGVEIAVLRPAGSNPGQKKMHLAEIPKFNRQASKFDKNGKGNGWDIVKAGLPGVGGDDVDGVNGAPAAALPGGAPLGLGAGPLRQGPGLTPPPGLGPGGPGPAKSKNIAGQIKGGLAGLRLGGGFGGQPAPPKKLEEKTAAPLQPKVEAQSKPNDQEGKIQKSQEQEEPKVEQAENKLDQAKTPKDNQKKENEAQDSQPAFNQAAEISVEKQEGQPPQDPAREEKKDHKNEIEVIKSESNKLEAIPHISTSKMSPEQLELLDASKEKWSQNQPKVQIPGFKEILCASADESNKRPPVVEDSSNHPHSNHNEIHDSRQSSSKQRSQRSQSKSHKSLQVGERSEPQLVFKPMDSNSIVDPASGDPILPNADKDSQLQKEEVSKQIQDHNQRAEGQQQIRSQQELEAKGKAEESADAASNPKAALSQLLYIPPKDINIVQAKYQDNDLSKILELNESSCPSHAVSSAQDHNVRYNLNLSESKQSKVGSYSISSRKSNQPGKDRRVGGGDNAISQSEGAELKSINEHNNSGGEESSQCLNDQRRQPEQLKQQQLQNQEEQREREQNKLRLGNGAEQYSNQQRSGGAGRGRPEEGMQRPLQQVDEESKSRDSWQQRSAEHARDDQERNNLNASSFAGQGDSGGQVPLRNPYKQEQSIGVADLELDPFKNPNAPVDLRRRVSQIMMKIDDQQSRFERHKIYKKNLNDNVYNNDHPDQYNVEDAIVDDEADAVNFLSSRFAEYGNHALSERNIVGHRPQSQASQRSLNDQIAPQNAQNNNLQWYKSFIPGRDSDINVRGMRNFERSGYGLARYEEMMNSNEGVSLGHSAIKPKNKLLTDKQHYIENGNKGIPPVRIFLDHKGQPEPEQDEKLNCIKRNSGNQKPVILAPQVRGQVQAPGVLLARNGNNMMPQRQYPLQQPAIPLMLPQGGHHLQMVDDMQDQNQMQMKSLHIADAGNSDSVKQQNNIGQQNFLMQQNGQIPRSNQGAFGMGPPSGYQIGQDLRQMNPMNHEMNIEGGQYVPQGMPQQMHMQYQQQNGEAGSSGNMRPHSIGPGEHANNYNQNMIGRADVGGRGGDQYLLNDSKDQVDNQSPRGIFPSQPAMNMQARIGGMNGVNQHPSQPNNIQSLPHPGNYPNMSQHQQMQMMQQQQLQYQMQQYQYNSGEMQGFLPMPLQPGAPGRLQTLEEQKNAQMAAKGQGMGGQGAPNGINDMRQQFSQPVQGYGQPFAQPNMQYVVQQNLQGASHHQQMQMQHLQNQQQQLQIAPQNSLPGFPSAQQHLQQHQVRHQNHQQLDSNKNQAPSRPQQPGGTPHQQRDVSAAKMYNDLQPGGGVSQGQQQNSQSSASDRGAGDRPGALVRSAGSRDSRASSGSSVRQNKPFAQYKFSVAQEPVVEEGVHDNSSGAQAKRGPASRVLQEPKMK